MPETNPIAFAEDLRKVLARYIATTLPISRRYPRLREHFRSLLEQERLVEGPHVEALPDFEKGKPLLDLLRVNGGFLHDKLAQLPTIARPLHQHQEEALRRAVVDGQSLLVATGTGSGKTETFLYPIVHALLSDPEPNKPGVRALLIYPMNALANDQLYYRIAPLLARFLKDSGITFGRYTGQVKSGAKRDEEEAKLLNNPKLLEALGYPSSIPKNWRLTRNEMLANPPKMLITNYAMLEHLLLLPRNAPLFANNALRFIVLDEIHTYYGAQATEVAFLLRKLKTRLGLNQGLQVFGTSASLSSGPDADEQLKSFASRLFGEEVNQIVRGRRIAHTALSRRPSGNFSLSVTQWVGLGEVQRQLLALDPSDQTVDAWNALVDAQDEDLSTTRIHAKGTEAPWRHLFDAFSDNEQARHVAELLEGGRVLHFAELAQLVFPEHLGEGVDQERHQALSSVIQVGMLARREPGEFPLLPGRYHLAVNSIEGISVLPGGSGEGWDRARVGRHFRDEAGQYFPLMTCRKCGQPFLEAWKDAGHVFNRRPDATDSAAQRMVFWLGEPLGGTEDEDDETDAAAPGNAHERVCVDRITGEISSSSEAIALYPVQTETDQFDLARYVKRCPSCGGRATGADAEVVTRMHPGNEALGAVVTQRVLEALPAGLIDHADPRPAFGRSLLTFSDNRQDAAFFAPYFERTSANVALRAALRQVLRDATTAMPIPQLAERVYEYWRRDGGQPLLLNEFGEIRTDKQDITQLLQGALGYEFCTPGGRRNSLESLGVALLTFDDAKLKVLLQQVRQFWPAGLPGDAASMSALTHMLLETVRRERALAKLHSVSMNDSAVWGDYNQHRTFDIETGDAGVRFKWLPGQQSGRHNRRSWYLIERLGLGREAALTFLRQFWGALVKPPVSLMKRHPPGFGMDGDLLRVRGGDGFPLYQCKSCGLFQRHVVADKCSGFGCRGDVLALDIEERARLRRENHYLASYEETNHLTMRAREHTASLSTELREDIEREFSEKRLNLLSCTTTMEMGVDLGDLEAVVNLNVPPGIANYQQRTGRAGRRAQAAPFCVTVARNTSYDQAVFRDLKGYLSSTPATPFINLANDELFLRHQMSVVLSHFFLSVISDRDVNAPSLKHLFGEVLTPDKKAQFIDSLHAWVEGDAGSRAFGEAEGLADRLPIELRSIATTGAYLKNAIVGRLREFSEDICERCSAYVARTAEAAAASDYGKAKYWQTQREQYMDQFLVNELSRRGLIPTYSFPVHSLTLEVQDGTKFGPFQHQAAVALSRDASYGISEYAPGAEVVANGRIWESAGLAQYPKSFMPERWYSACQECFHVDVGDTPQDVPSACSNCGSTTSRRRRKFVEPKGFVTSADKKRGRDPGSSRRRVKPADEARLIAAPRAEQFQATELPFLQTALLLARGAEGSSLKGSLFVANRGVYGEGYYRCAWCNYCEPFKRPSTRGAGAGAGASRKFNHSDPATGQKCKNDVLPKLGLDFAHTFNTDVRLLRFLAPLPEPGEGDPDARRYQERVARTIAEACRLGASDLLSLHPGELRSTYRLYSTAGNTLEVVLYDGVPGGAGYSARIGEPQFSLPALLQAARARLECPAQCESACRACLCDYGNQRHWDSFERLAALGWLDSLMAGKPAAEGPGRYVSWPKPSLAGLDGRFKTYDSISIIAASLCGTDADGEADLNQVLAWLRSGKQIRLFIANKLDANPKEYAQLLLYRHLYPYAQEGKLSVFALDGYGGKQAAELPRLFASLEDGAPLIRQPFPVQPVFAGLIASPAEVGAVDAAVRRVVEALIGGAKAYPSTLFAEGSNMSMWELPAGQRRNLPEIFAAVSGQHIKKLTIKDPYCGAPNNRRRVQELVRALTKQVLQIDNVQIYCSETRDRDGNIEHRYDVARKIETMVTAEGVTACEAFVREAGSGGRTFHDRELSFDAVDGAGCDVTHRYFLTGGVDYLLDERSETRVFHSRVAR